jgi:hypothetical protein
VNSLTYEGLGPLMHKLALQFHASRLYSLLTPVALTVLMAIEGQLADRGSVKVFSSGSALDGGPSLYLQSPLHHDHGAHFREIASFEPFGGSGGARVATTSTTTGANLLVSGIAPEGMEASVIKYDFVRPNAQAMTLNAVRLGQVWSGKASAPPALGGD